MIRRIFTFTVPIMMKLIKCFSYGFFGGFLLYIPFIATFYLVYLHDERIFYCCYLACCLLVGFITLLSIICKNKSIIGAILRAVTMPVGVLVAILLGADLRVPFLIQNFLNIHPSDASGNGAGIAAMFLLCVMVLVSVVTIIVILIRSIVGKCKTGDSSAS